ncbi:MAG: hypothetical protein LAN62_05085 [Acidobacteriia bacterium]|nr:hypothetical protein [Terriglobia bacterium]
MASVFLNKLWPGLLVWIALYVSDYILTITCARLYQAGVKNTIVFEGSYEITPYFQRDVNMLRRVSPRFLAALVLIGAVLSSLWWLTRQVALPEAYDFALGVFISLQLAIHTRHLRNLFLFRAILRGDGIRGRVEYSRPQMLRLSALELIALAGVFAVLFLFTENWFLLGGTIGCLGVAGKHWRLAREHVPKPTAT